MRDSAGCLAPALVRDEEESDEEESDEELVPRAAAGERDAFWALRRRHGEWMTSIGRHGSPQLRDPAKADDWVEKVLQEAIGAYDGTRGMSFRSFLNLRTASRLRQPRQAQFIDDAGEVEVEHADRDVVELEDTRRELKAFIARLWNRLGEGPKAKLDHQVLRWLIDLRYYEHPRAPKTQKDLAQLLGEQTWDICRSVGRIERIAREIRKLGDEDE